ncbi:MAG: methylmalonyl-CoA mutase family protein [Bacteroidota bacterium]
MKEEPKQRLFEEFPAIATETWEEKIRADLKGSDYEKKLVWKTGEGIAVKPYYRAEDLQNLSYLNHISALKYSGSAPNSWTICQDIFPGKDLEEARQRIKSALKGGAQAIRIQLGHMPGPGKIMIERLLHGVRLDETEILFNGCPGADALYGHFVEVAAAAGISPADLKGLIGADPLGKMAASGLPLAITENLGNLVKKSLGNTPGLRVIDVNGALFQNAGSTLVEELAFSLSMANEYMVLLTGQGVEAAGVVGSMQLSLASGSNYFMEIAKLRAARILWAQICKEYGLETESGKIRIHSTTSQWNMTLYDPHVNMLRGTTEAMSSILGGADLITVLPFDHPTLNSNAFSDRIARNVQIILRDEAYLERVNDPSSGSYYIESLTDSIAEKACDLFRKTEAKGGFRKAFQSGWIQELVLSSKKKKSDLIASGSSHILGTNAYPNFHEFIHEQLGRGAQDEEADASMVPLRPFRSAAMFEELRLETESSVKRPRVFLFKYGNPAWGSARAAFSGNFFACAGYEILEPHAFDSLEPGIAAAMDAQAEIVVLCSSDDSYTAMAPPVVEALKDKAIVVVAGYPADTIQALQEAGIEHFIHLKSKLLETLKQFNKLILLK